MPRRSYRISKIINAPISYVFGWCTDFRHDDPKILGASYTRHIVDKTEKRVVWIQHYTREGAEMEGVRYVTLSPPNKWHLESVNEEADRVGDYKLSSLGKKTRLEIVIRPRFKSIEPESLSKLRKDLSADWDKYRAALEKDYKEHR